MSDGWIDSIAKAYQYKLDALDFLSRVREQFPSSNPTHAGVVSKLWIAADDMDKPVNIALAELNQGLLSDKGEIEITRGASMQPGSSSQIEFNSEFSDSTNDQFLGQMGSFNPDRLIYECTWSLSWRTNDDEYAIAFRLIANANTGELRALVNGFNFPENYDITFPLIGNELKDGLAKAYVEEATSNETKAMLQKILVQNQSVMYESDQNIEG